MSDDLINQLTLNFLISKQQLQKLNKKTKETADQTKLREIEEYNDRIKKLFSDLLVCQPPDDLLFEVKNTFDNFIEKAIYYFKAHDNSEALEIERTTNKTREIYEDIDYEKQEKAIENGNYKERSCSEESQYEASLYSEAEIDEEVERFLKEADEDVNVEDDGTDVNVDVEGDKIDVQDKGIDTTVDVGLSKEEKVVQDSLQAAMEAANSLGNQKLADQIGNTITFFTREYVVGRNSD